MDLPTTGYVRETQLIGDRRKGTAGVVPFSHATLWRKVGTGEFPAPVKLSAGITAWKVEDVRAWMEGRATCPAPAPSRQGIDGGGSLPGQDIRTMNTYLTAAELAELIGCAPTSFACMRRYLERHSWPFEPNLRGFPQVSRAYHAARMHGLAAPATTQGPEAEPDFSMFEK